MSSQQQAISLIGATGIDHLVIRAFERHSGTAADWGTVIDDELGLGRSDLAEVAEELFLELLPEYEWTAPDMTLLQSLNTVEEWIQVFEGLCDDQGSDDDEPMFRFNFG
jgi:hypothetical protein